MMMMIAVLYDDDSERNELAEVLRDLSSHWTCDTSMETSVCLLCNVEDVRNIWTNPLKYTKLLNSCRHNLKQLHSLESSMYCIVDTMTAC